MPRTKRIEYPGAHYHVMCRGNNGQDIFVSDDGRRLFLSTLGEVCTQMGWRVHAYVLMSNHYHLLIETPEANLVRGMSWFQSTYTQRFNAMFQRQGHLYQGRYKSIPIATDPREGGLVYFRQVSSYIHLNPFRAKICGEGYDEPLESYTWSSYPRYCDLSLKTPKWFVRSKVLRSHGLGKEANETLKTYPGILQRRMRFEEDSNAGRRGEFEKEVKRGWYLGDETFRERLVRLLDAENGEDLLRGDQRRAHGETEAERIWSEGISQLNLNEKELRKGKSTRLEKQALGWMMRSYTAARVSWIADRFEYGHPSTASLAIHRFDRDRSPEALALKTFLIENLLHE